jgi:lysophospholipase L1-like esterase
MTKRYDGHFAACVLALSLAASPAAALSLSPSCAVPDPIVALDGRLDEALAQASGDGELTILTIGSSSTEGVGASAPDMSYPARLEVELERRLPELEIDVVNKGIGGEVVEKTAQRLRTEVEALDPDLVIWQLGTNDALRNVGASEFERIVNEGLSWLAERDTDVVLMDPQLFPRIAESDAYKAFVDRVSAMAGHAGVPLVRRFAAMTHWAALPEAVRRPMLSADAFHMNDQGYSCLAEMLAEGLTRRIAGTATGGKVLASETKAPAPAKAGLAETAPAPATADSLGLAKTEAPIKAPGLQTSSAR